MLHLREVLTRCIFVGLCADMAKAAKDEFHTHPMAQSVGEHLPDTISTAIHSTHAELEGVLASCVALLRAVGSEQQEEKVEKESGGRLCFCSRWRLGKCSLFFFFFFFFFWFCACALVILGLALSIKTLREIAEKIALNTEAEAQLWALFASEVRLVASEAFVGLYVSVCVCMDTCTLTYTPSCSHDTLSHTPPHTPSHTPSLAHTHTQTSPSPLIGDL